MGEADFRRAIAAAIDAMKSSRRNSEMSETNKTHDPAFAHGLRAGKPGESGRAACNTAPKRARNDEPGI